MKQNIGSYSFDAVTREEAREDLKAELGNHLSHLTRELVRGIKPIKLPILTALASGTTTSIGAGNQVSCGPEQGYFWTVRRLTVTSNGTDNGAVSLYVGSDPSELDQIHLVDNTLKIGAAYYPSNRALLLWPGERLYFSATTVASNSYRATGVAVEVPAEMVGKILG